MNYQHHMIDATQKAADEFFRYALAVPSEKLDWKPLDAGRSVLDQAREVAKCADWTYELIGTDKPFEFDESKMAEQKVEMDEWSTAAECQRACNEKLARLFELYRGLPDARLVDTKWLPFDGGRDFTVAEMMEYPRWNFNYHLGQVAYVQTLYGDKDMH